MKVTRAARVGVVNDGGTLSGVNSTVNPSLGGDTETLYRPRKTIKIDSKLVLISTHVI